MKGQRYFIVISGLTIFLSGCAAGTSEMSSLKEQVRMQQKQISDIKARQDEQRAKLEILDNGFKILSDEVDENNRRVDDLEKSDLSGIDRPPPIVATPVEPPRPAAPPVPPPPPGPAPVMEEVVVQPTLSAADLYRSALDNFTRENYRRAVLEFEEFVANHPQHDLADNAQYWIGECYYAQKNFAQAVEEFGKVERHFGEGNKVSAALLKKGLALRELELNDEAVVTLEKVISAYPTSDEATIAEKKISQWQ